MPKKILIADDNEDFRKAITEIVSSAGYEVMAVENGKAAAEILESYCPDLVLSDYQMPYMDGLELLSHIKSHTPKTPVILVTALTHILETKKAYEMGADDFFTKPLKSDDVIASIKKHLDPKSAYEIQSEEMYCRIPLQDFVSHEIVRVNVHIRLSPTKYVRVAHKGDRVPFERVENYKNKGVTFLYAYKEDFAQIVGFNLRLVKKVTTDTSISREKRANFMRYTTETIMEQIVVTGISPKSYEDAKECMASYMDLVSDSQALCNILEALNGHAEWVYAHSLGVSVYSILIAKQMGWTSSQTFFKLGMAALMHDIGLKEVDPKILSLPRMELDHQSRHIYETHTVRGREILETLREIPGEIAQIVQEHHEACHGMGYPSRLTKEKIHPLARIISVADAFCYETLKGPQSEGCDAKTAIHKMSTSGGFDPAAIEALAVACHS